MALPKKLKAYVVIGFIIWTVVVIFIIKQHFFNPDLSSTAKQTPDLLHSSPDNKDDLNAIVHVCLSSDEDRLIGVVATINSVFKNTRNPVKFHILVSPTARQPLIDWIAQSQLKSIHHDIKAFDVDLMKSKIRIHSGRPELAQPMNYARFYYTEYFPDLTGHAVHIDDDCIIQGDIAKLSRLPLSNNLTVAFSNDCRTVSKRFAGADREYFKYLNFTNPNIESLGLKPLECSFNTGVYAFDADAWRAQNITKRLEFWTTLNAHEPVYGNTHGGGGSQPPMMIVFYQRYLLLDPLWNVRHLGMPASGRHYSPEMISRAQLLHWSGPIKPWHGHAAYTDVWDRYFLPDPTGKHRPVRKYGGVTDGGI